MNDNKQQHAELSETFEYAHQVVEAAALATWQAQGLVNALSLINRSAEGKEARQMRESLLEALSEKIDATHQMLSQLESQMLHQINS